MRRVWGMLALRSLLSFGLLLIGALIYRLSGSSSSIANASSWWLWYVTIANFASIGLLMHFAQREGFGCEISISPAARHGKATCSGSCLPLQSFR